MVISLCPYHRITRMLLLSRALPLSLPPHCLVLESHLVESNYAVGESNLATRRDIRCPRLFVETCLSLHCALEKRPVLCRVLCMPPSSSRIFRTPTLGDGSPTGNRTPVSRSTVWCDSRYTTGLYTNNRLFITLPFTTALLTSLHILRRTRS